MKVLERIRTYFSRLKILLQLLDWLCLFFCFCCFFLGFLSVLSIYFSPNKHKILSASFSSSTLKSDVRRKQKCPILPPVFCFRDGINLSEPIICSDLLGILHCMSTRELSIESLWFSRIYLFFSPPSGWLAVAPYSCGSVAHLQFLLARAWLPPASPQLSHGSLCHHTKSHREMQPQGGRGWGAAPPLLLSVPPVSALGRKWSRQWRNWNMGGSRKSDNAIKYITTCCSRCESEISAGLVESTFFWIVWILQRVMV